MLHQSLSELVQDPTFNTKSPVAIEARESAVQLMEFCTNSENLPTLTAFSTDLLDSFKKLFEASNFKKDKLFRSFFLMRSSRVFVDKWEKFLKSVPCAATPVMYQHVVDLIFEKLVYAKFQVSSSESDPTDIEPITENEANALRYAAGYVCRHLRRKLENGNHHLKEEMILCLMALVKDRLDETVGPAEEWTEKIDRGGLWHVKETTYALFLSLEREMRLCLKHLSSKPTETHKSTFIEKICSSDDVLFDWLISSADFEIEDNDAHEELLKKVVELFITVRGFAFASVWVEKYKQENKKATQRSKGLRKELYTNDDSSSCNL